MKPSVCLFWAGILVCLIMVDARHQHKRHFRRLHHNRAHASHHAQLEDELRSEVETSPGTGEVQEGEESDPCNHVTCKDGEHCVVEETKAECVCIDSCSKYNDPRSHICSSRNITYDSECEFYRQMCICKKGDRSCQDPRILEQSDHLDYYGACQEIRPCQVEELKAFPSRMAKWLTNVMETLDKRQELDVKFSDMHRRSRRTKSPEIVPILWEFCQMDSSKDRIVTRSELFPLIAPLKPLEHCIGDFLDGCDGNSDGEITLEEWGRCLEIPDDRIEDICDGLETHHVRLQG